MGVMGVCMTVAHLPVHVLRGPVRQGGRAVVPAGAPPSTPPSPPFQPTPAPHQSVNTRQCVVDVEGVTRCVGLPPGLSPNDPLVKARLAGGTCSGRGHGLN